MSKVWITEDPVTGLQKTLNTKEEAYNWCDAVALLRDHLPEIINCLQNHLSDYTSYANKENVSQLQSVLKGLVDNQYAENQLTLNGRLS